jgi:hypothetical protein
MVTDLGGIRDERTMLEGFLDWNRAVAAAKVAGLTREEATRAATPTGLTLLGVVAHLAWVEDLWFTHRFRGGPEPAGDHPGSFLPGPADTVESVVSGYEAACDRSRAVVAGAALDEVSVRDHPIYGRVTLRWIVVHMVEETARHAGHLDILREQTDGRTGD